MTLDKSREFGDFRMASWEREVRDVLADCPLTAHSLPIHCPLIARLLIDTSPAIGRAASAFFAVVVIGLAVIQQNFVTRMDVFQRKE